MKNIIAFKIDKNTFMQWGGAKENVWYAKEIYPLWICRFYIINIKSEKNVKQLKSMGAEVIILKNDDNWPNIVYEDADDNNILIRDVESRLSYKDRLIVENKDPNTFNGTLFRHSKQSFLGQKLLPERPVFLYFCQDMVYNGGLWIYALIKDIIKYSKYRTTNNLKKASIVVAIDELTMKKFIDKHPNMQKKYIVYCAEPRMSTIKKHKIIYKRKIINIMNCYTGNIFINIFHDAQHIFKFNHFNRSKLIDREKFHNKIIVIASNRYGKDMIHDLTKLRYRIVIQGYARGVVSVHGAGWPKGISKGQTRYIKDIYEHKLDMMKGYYFNLCLENTDIDNYVSEKIWHSVISGCLPIYYGNDAIYKFFPKDSFIDCKGKNVKQILNEIKNIKWEDYLDRFNRCYDVVKRVRWIDVINAKNIRSKMFLDRLRKIDI